MALKNEKNLLKSIKKGDQESFGKLYDHNFEKIYRFVSIKINNLSETEEIVQDIFFKFWTYVREGNQVKSSAALLYKIARNSIADHYRKTGVIPQVISLEAEEGYKLTQAEISHQDIQQELDITFQPVI